MVLSKRNGICSQYDKSIVLTLVVGACYSIVVGHLSSCCSQPSSYTTLHCDYR